VSDDHDVYRAVVEAIARTVVRETSSGTCEYGSVCTLCDCFAGDGDGGRYRDQVARQAARQALAEWQRAQ